MVTSKTETINKEPVLSNLMRKKHFADFYDALADKKEAGQRSLKVQKYINKHHKKAKSILELGTGNGNVLSFFPEKYKLSGLDIEKRYVKLAKRKVKRAKLYAASMHNFEIPDKFDAIFSIFDSINFLKNFKQWKQTFDTVHKHLNDSGLFIFDMYTPLMLKETKKAKPRLFKESFGFLLDKGIVKGNTLTWHFHIYEKKKGNKYNLHSFFFTEKIFPPNKAEALLRKKFKILEKVDGDTLKKPGKYTTRLLYVVRKK